MHQRKDGLGVRFALCLRYLYTNEDAFRAHRTGLKTIFKSRIVELIRTEIDSLVKSSINEYSQDTVTELIEEKFYREIETKIFNLVQDKVDDYVQEHLTEAIEQRVADYNEEVIETMADEITKGAIVDDLHDMVDERIGVTLEERIDVVVEEHVETVAEERLALIVEQRLEKVLDNELFSQEMLVKVIKKRVDKAAKKYMDENIKERAEVQESMNMPSTIDGHIDMVIQRSIKSALRYLSPSLLTEWKSYLHFKLCSNRDRSMSPGRDRPQLQGNDRPLLQSSDRNVRPLENNAVGSHTPSGSAPGHKTMTLCGFATKSGPCRIRGENGCHYHKNWRKQ